MVTQMPLPSVKAWYTYTSFVLDGLGCMLVVVVWFVIALAMLVGPEVSVRLGENRLFMSMSGR